jgi:hypothetical protein
MTTPTAWVEDSCFRGMWVLSFSTPGLLRASRIAADFTIAFESLPAHARGALDGRMHDFDRRDTEKRRR